jgi:hypothetical protein
MLLSIARVCACYGTASCTSSRGGSVSVIAIIIEEKYDTAQFVKPPTLQLGLHTDASRWATG